MKFSIKDYFSKCDQIRRIHLLQKSFMETFIFCAVYTKSINQSPWKIEWNKLGLSKNNETNKTSAITISGSIKKKLLSCLVNFSR